MTVSLWSQRQVAAQLDLTHQVDVFWWSAKLSTNKAATVARLPMTTVRLIADTIKV
jgi:hypothetical protein